MATFGHFFTMRYTQIKKTEKIKQKASILYLFSNENKLDKALLNQDEIAWLKQIVSGKADEIHAFNKLGYFVFALKVEDTLLSNLEKIRKKAASLVAKLNGAEESEIQLVNQTGNYQVALAAAEGLALANYQFSRHINKKKGFKAHTLKTISVLDKEVSSKQLTALQHVVNASLKARDLVNEPLNFLNATDLANLFQEMGKEAGFKVTVLNKKKIESLKMGGLLAVNKGSIDPPTFSILEYKPAKPANKKPIVLVGKGVVYDTGGISLKSTANMDTMKCDMAGAAAVGCTLYAVAMNKLNVHVIGLVPATDNRPDGNACVPGDIITISDGTTVEVLNTDAEGRLILSDALVYARQYKPELVIDLATLTGSAVAAIGTFGTVMMGNADKSIKQKLVESGEQVNERLAEFPFWDEYAELIKSEIADLKNVGGPLAGSITAGKFLEHFTNYPYIHLDIAGPAFLDNARGYLTKGGTGVGVRLLVDFLSKYSN